MTLTEASYYVRRALPFLIISFLSFLIIYYIVQLFILYIESQKTGVVINPVFGKIKKLDIKGASPSAELDFTLDTIEGVPVTATAGAQVYFLPPQTPRLGYREKIYLIAQALGFDTQTVKHTLSGTTAKFDDGSQSLTIDISTFNFSYNYDFKNNSGIFSSSVVPTQEEAQAQAVEFLTTINRYPQELASGKTNILYFYFNSSDKTMRQINERTDTTVPNLVEVDFYRPDLEGFPTVSPSYFNSQNFVLLHASPAGYRILRAQIKFFERSTEHIGVYPVKSGQDAYQALTQGEGFIVATPSAQKIAIKRMFMGYYDPQEYEEYLRPVYVFLGDNNFVGYVDGLTSEYLVE